MGLSGRILQQNLIDVLGMHACHMAKGTTTPSFRGESPSDNIREKNKRIDQRMLECSCIGRESNPGLADIPDPKILDGNGQFYH